LLIAPEGTENDELNTNKNGSKIVKAATVEFPNQRISFQTGTIEAANVLVQNITTELKKKK